MFCSMKKKRGSSPSVEDIPQFKRCLDVKKQESVIRRLQVQFGSYHKIVGDLSRFYRVFSEQIKELFDWEHRDWKLVVQASEAFQCLSDSFDEQIMLVRSIGTVWKDLLRGFEGFKPISKSFEQDAKKKKHYAEKMLQLKQQRDLLIGSGKKLSSRISSQLERVLFFFL